MADQTWTGNWIAERIESRSGVDDVEVVETQVLRVTRTDHPPMIVGTLSSPRVGASDLYSVFEQSQDVELVVNIPKESFWTGEAIDLLRDRAIAFGGMGDLHRAIDQPFVRSYRNPEYDFVLRGFKQHTKVESVKRLHDRLFLLKRFGLPDVTVVVLNEYELVADHIRTARDRYGGFTDVLISNPNGSPTTGATRVASDLGADIYKWGEFLGRLNRR